MRDIVPVVEENSLRVTPTGCEMKLRLKWYRSLPVSCIDRLHLSLDGHPVDGKAMRFSINDRQFKIDELTDLVEEFWFVQDSAVLSVIQAVPFKPGESHQIDVEFALRFPYIAIGPGKFLTHFCKYSATQVAF